MIILSRKTGPIAACKNISTIHSNLQPQIPGQQPLEARQRPWRSSPSCWGSPLTLQTQLRSSGREEQWREQANHGRLTEGLSCPPALTSINHLQSLNLTSIHLNFRANESKEDWLKDDPHLAKSVAHRVVVCPSLPAGGNLSITLWLLTHLFKWTKMVINYQESKSENSTSLHIFCK